MIANRIERQFPNRHMRTNLETPNHYFTPLSLNLIVYISIYLYIMLIVLIKL
jgi:hypothetical protein